MASVNPEKIIKMPSSMTTFKTHGIKTEFQPTTTNDGVYESIEMCPLTKVIIDTRHVQRLRMLEQLGCSYLTFMNATHKRYEHSLGVMHLGRLVCETIATKQPKLGITPKEIKCVSIAGLLHDLGHGPFSHNYELFLKLLDKALKCGSFLGYAFDTDGIYKGYRDITDGWEHEDASLMMVDDLLRHLGLEIDETNLDAPLKQIGDGIDATLFGLYSTGYTAEDSDDEDADRQKRTTNPLPIDRVLTSRDWIFIKECIIGHPLPPKGMSIRSFKRSKLPKVMIGRPDPFKEFLYDIICNRHSGLDVDKMDYLMRDTLRCHGANIVAHIVFRLIEKALVAWGECSDPLTCWKCQQNVNGLTRHLMICFPKKEAQNVMDFFGQRYREHRRIYTHAKTQSFSYQICDILLLAEPYFRIISEKDCDDPELGVDTRVRCPISRAMMYAESYLDLDDSVLECIKNCDDIRLRPARLLYKRYKDHKKYKKIVAHIIDDASTPWTRKLWALSEDDIVREILSLSLMRMSDYDGDELVEHDIIIEKNTIHHGMKDKNPIDYVRFLDPKKYPKSLNKRPEDLPTAEKPSDADFVRPSRLTQSSVRVYCRSLDIKKQDHLKRCYEDLIDNLKTDQCSNVQFEEMPLTPPRNMNDEAEFANNMPFVSQTPVKYEACAPPVPKRQRNDNTPSLFSQVVGQK